MDGDGTPEVLADDTVYDGATGDALFSLSDHAYYHLAAVADVDLDGDQEVFLDGEAFDSDGTHLWSSGRTNIGGFWADGTEIAGAAYTTLPQPGPPCVGDFDGDGSAEVAWGNDQEFVECELDGTEVWTAPMDDATGQAGCAGFDVDGDGALEVLFADQTSFRILDGHRSDPLRGRRPPLRDGVRVPRRRRHRGDGHAEILVVNSGILGGSAPALVVYGHAGSGWPPWGDLGTARLRHDEPGRRRVGSVRARTVLSPPLARRSRSTPRTTRALEPSRPSRSTPCPPVRASSRSRSRSALRTSAAPDSPRRSTPWLS